MTISEVQVGRSTAKGGLVAAFGGGQAISVWALLAASLVLYWPTVYSMALLWSDTDRTTYTHGYLITAVVLWMLWRNRSHLTRQAPMPVYWLNVATVLVGLAWLVFYRAGLQVVHQLLLPVIVWLAILSACGTRIARMCAFPLAYIVFAIPVWDYVNDLLQTGTVLAVGVALKAGGVPTYIEGNLVHIPAGDFVIAGGCSGLHFLIVAVAIAAVYGEVHRASVRSRAWLVIIAVGMSVLTNWVRVFVIILAGHLTDMQHYLVRVDHYYFGWGVFVLMMFVFFSIARRLPTATLATEDRSHLGSSSGFSSLARGTVVAMVSLAIAPLWSTLVAAESVPPQSAQLVSVDDQWNGPFASSIEWLPSFVSADRQVMGSYASDGGMVEVFIAEYAVQHQGKEMVGYSNSLSGERLVVETTGMRESADGNDFNELEVTSAGGARSVIWYQYQVGSRFYASGLWSQLAYGVASLRSQPASRIVAVRAACVASCDQARELLTQFLSYVGVPRQE